jgi:hypothetical protein
MFPPQSTAEHRPLSQANQNGSPPVYEAKRPRSALLSTFKTPTDRIAIRTGKSGGCETTADDQDYRVHYRPKTLINPAKPIRLQDYDNPNMNNPVANFG